MTTITYYDFRITIRLEGDGYIASGRCNNGHPLDGGQTFATPPMRSHYLANRVAEDTAKYITECSHIFVNVSREVEEIERDGDLYDIETTHDICMICGCHDYSTITDSSPKR